MGLSYLLKHECQPKIISPKNSENNKNNNLKPKQPHVRKRSSSFGSITDMLKIDTSDVINLQAPKIAVKSTSANDIDIISLDIVKDVSIPNDENIPKMNRKPPKISLKGIRHTPDDRYRRKRRTPSPMSNEPPTPTEVCISPKKKPQYYSLNDHKKRSQSTKIFNKKRKRPQSKPTKPSKPIRPRIRFESLSNKEKRNITSNKSSKSSRRKFSFKETSEFEMKSDNNNKVNKFYEINIENNNIEIKNLFDFPNQNISKNLMWYNEIYKGLLIVTHESENIVIKCIQNRSMLGIRTRSGRINENDTQFGTKNHKRVRKKSKAKRKRVCDTICYVYIMYGYVSM